MHVTILSARTGWHTDQLCQAVEARGGIAVVRAYETLVARPGIASPAFGLETDVVLARIIPNGSLEQIIFRVDALHAIEESGVRVMNSAGAIERSVDKCHASLILERAGLPTPETVACERMEDAMDAFRAFGYVVVKPLFGSMGLGMVRVTDEEMAFRVFRAIDLVRGVFYVQRTIDHGGRDMRAFVVGDEVIGAIERTASPEGPEWRTNFSRGGSVRAITLSPEWCTMARRAAQAIGAEYAGVDLITGRDGQVYVLEVNGIPGWQGLHEATGIDVAGAIVNRVGAA